MSITLKSSFILLSALAMLTVACSSQSSDDAVGGDSGSNQSGAGGQGGERVPTSQGGMSGLGASGGIAGSMSGGAGGGGGGGGGGSGGKGGTGGTSGLGGATNMGGTSGAGGAGGAATTVKPSAGCAKAEARPSGGQVIVAGKYYFTFPTNYDGKKPFPVFLGFHGCGAGNRGTTKDNTEWISLSKGTAFENDYVRAVPISSDAGGCWNYAIDVPAVLKMYDDLIANHCVDTAAVFATGHSSGAQLLVQILSDKHPTDAQHLNIKAVAPVAASDYGAVSGPTPIMYIQGKMDAERGNGDGHETVERFKTANKCMNSSTAYAPVMGCTSQGGGATVAPGCVSYAGCTVPTIWCSHNDPFYSGTMHGVPCFGMKAMSDFFQTFR